ncbi:centrosomal protein of 164 kDa isoform X2 [Nasonia vitripennis]|uniref:WW domain-containing protein n=1 Tax=Nasonia vitripennis TaxID=7425 RepID=A0A7M7M619_NASVI|nr:centrosomal protein of 164 kDa isoform X2 [Nasonia vitripennis]
MSISHDSASTIVCKEVFDENSQPSEKEVIDYARRLGIDPDSEPYLLDLAREGLMAALPKGWTPVYNDAAKSFYYYQRSTNVTTWEHPLDAVYKDLVAQARASNRRRASVDEDSKIGADDAEPDYQQLPVSSGLPPPVPGPLKSPTTRIPMKLAPLKRHRSESSSGFPRRSPSSLDRLTRGWKSGDSDMEPHSSSARSSLSSDRASRDYTNLRFQDPQFYESPKLMDNDKKKLDFRDVLKRSESLSPRYEEDWRQLSNRFSSDENIIDIENLASSALKQKSRTPLTPSRETASSPVQVQQQQLPKELTLSGGGSIFLKSNRSRDTTPCHDETRPLEDPQAAGGSDLVVPGGGSLDDMSASTGERLKSILREKAAEDDERPFEEERKSVRFDLQKVAIQTAVTKFNDSDSDEEDTEGSGPEERTGGIASVIAARRAAAVFSLQQVLNRQGGADFGPSRTFVKRVDIDVKNPKIIGNRFVVENVSEKEHMQQQESRSIDDEEFLPNKFENVKNIDLISKSDSEKTTPRSSESRSSFLDDLRKSKEIMMENMKKSELRAKKIAEDEARIAENQSWSSKMLRSLELSKEGIKSPSSENLMTNLEAIKNNMIKENENEIRIFKQELDSKLEAVKNQLEKEFSKEKQSLEASIQKKLLELRKEMTSKEEHEIKKLIEDMGEVRADNLKKVRNELEVCYEKERQDILSNLKGELDQRKRELLELRSQEISKLENEHERGLDDDKQAKIVEMEITRQHNERIEDFRKELAKEFDNVRADLRAQQREKITKITEDHEKCLADILRDFRVDEGLARKVYKQRLDEIRTDYSKDVENEMKKHNDSAVRQESVDFEKIRCEKRLLEDKYNTLKGKYLKLKKDMRAAIEKRNRRKEQANTTASETEMSTSTRTRTERTESTDQKSLLTKTNSISNSKPKEISRQNSNALKDQQSDFQQQQPQQRLVVTSAATQAANQPAAAATALQKTQKFESDDTTTCSETTSNLLMMSRKKKCFTKKPSTGANKINNNMTDNPVENIRKQLEKLEDLGDQLPSNETAYTVRYPFQDKSPTNVSSELEFFRHRIHVERDSVKRAREALRQQRSAFQSRQRAWKQRSARATLEQLVKEERELSDMEVSLHRTRSLLGEKVIHLRHLEQSLERVANAKRSEYKSPTPAAATTTGNKSDEVTLSDMSSASSGFSSTDLGTDTFIDKYCHYQESTEIIASLENLNSEIREIWGVLNKRQDNTIPPPPTLMYTDLSWFPYQHLTTQPTTVSAAFGTPNIQSNILSQLTAGHPPSATQNIIAQYGPTSGYTTSVGTVEGSVAPNLIERTRNLKDWLRQARVETSDLVSPGQATL